MNEVRRRKNNGSKKSVKKRNLKKQFYKKFIRRGKVFENKKSGDYFYW